MTGLDGLLELIWSCAVSHLAALLEPIGQLPLCADQLHSALPFCRC